MPEERSDLWPDKFEPATVRTPEEILVEQARLLEEKTGGLVVASVQDASEYSKTGFAKRFSLYAPKLGHYQYVLFKVIHPVTLYPVEFLDTPTGRGRCDAAGEYLGPWKAKSEKEFRELLSEILASEETRKIIAGLMAESRAKAGASF